MKKAALAVIAVIAASAAGLALAHPGFPGHKGPFGPGFICAADYHGAFRHADADHSKALSQDELNEAVKQLTADIAKQKSLLKDFKTADTDKNGFITLDELAQVLPPPPPPPLPPKADRRGKHERPDGHKGPRHGKPGEHRGPRHGHHPGPGPHRGFKPGMGMPPGNPVMDVLFHYDQDRNLKLSQQEYESFLTDAGKCQDLHAKVAAALPKSDLNGDGVVTFMEYNAVISTEMLKNAPKWEPRKGKPAPDAQPDSDEDEEEEFSEED